MCVCGNSECKGPAVEVSEACLQGGQGLGWLERSGAGGERRGVCRGLPGCGSEFRSDRKCGETAPVGQGHALSSTLKKQFGCQVSRPRDRWSVQTTVFCRLGGC